MATQEKDRGNEYYHCGDFELAVKHYTSSILLYPTPNAYNNRAIACELLYTCTIPESVKWVRKRERWKERKF
jgi:tetratricopeptide (TPR) repeat protein